MNGMIGPTSEGSIRRRVKSPLRIDFDLSVHLNEYPCPGITTFMQPIVDKSCMAADGEPSPCCLEVGLCADSILEIAEMIGVIGERFDDRNAQVGWASLCPLRDGL